MKLGVVYHTPFWREPDGSLWEAEGSLARYLDSLAPYFDEVVLCAPELPSPRPAGSRVRAANVRLAALPYFAGPRQFYPAVRTMLPHLRRFVDGIDLLHCRVPTPAAYPAFKLARRRGIPAFLLVVGDLRGLLPMMNYRGVKRLLFAAYTAFEEWALGRMSRAALTFANGAALTRKHQRPGATVHETKTTTISVADVFDRPDTCRTSPIRLLCVSRIDPRKGLRCLPSVVRELGAAGHAVTIDIVGPTIGLLGEQERAAIAADARARGVEDRLRFLGPMPLDQLLPRYRGYDLFVLPTGPGEGIPRVLLEAMASGLPVVTTAVAGIPSLIDDGSNGLLVPEASATAVASAVRRLIETPALRQSLIRAGYVTARAHLLETQAARMMAKVTDGLGVTLRRSPEAIVVQAQA
jgi:glycosyltransferase involved in cell wall biosynthesis